MHKERKLKERDTNLNIVESGKVEVDDKLIDINNMLNKGVNKVYREKQISKIDLSTKDKNGQCKVHIIPCGSGDIPFMDEFKESKVCILNFASSKHAGGGFMTGAYAQEEDLCYHSNLFQCLDKENAFYEFNRQHLNKGLYVDGVIFTTDVLFFRKQFENIEPVFADVITCAAPNKGAALRNGVKHSEVDRVMSRRLEQILRVAIDNERRTLVLGAFGCGVFKNDINYVALLIKKLLFFEGYSKYFDNIILPTVKLNCREYNAFVSTFNGITGLNIVK